MPLKIEMDFETQKFSIEANDTTADLAVGCASIIGAIYDQVYKDSPEAAAWFQRYVIDAVTDPESPVWKVTEKEGR